MITQFKTIASPTESLFKDKGSKFLAYAYPVKEVDDVKLYLDELKELHPKAVHHCYAYRIGTDGSLVRANDDGEPSGSAGRPILGQIDSLNLVNVLVVVVRYFGGVLLGVPGLINAYKASTQLALEIAEFIEEKIMLTGQLSCSYTNLGEILNIIKSVDGVVNNTKMEYDCHVDFSIPIDALDVFQGKMEKFYSVEYTFSQ